MSVVALATKPACDIHPRYVRAEQLEHEIVELCAHLNAATYRLLELVAELDETEPWAVWGLKSCAHWLNWRCGIGLVAAREKVRVAHALKSLPEISAVFKSGEVSYSKVRAMTRVATPENEAYLLTIARYGTAAQLEKLVRGYRTVKRLEARRQREERFVQWSYEDDGSLVIKAVLPPEQGAVVLKALDAAAEALENDESGASASITPEGATEKSASAEACSENPTFAQRRADALVLMAETLLEHGARPSSSADRYQVVLHASAETFFDGSSERCEIAGGPAISIDTLRRIGCDSSVVTLIEDEDGYPLNIGRKTRAVPPAMQRALKARDGGCRFPGCTHERFVDAHHIVHWADGGETSLDNLVQLCRYHHHLVHDGGFGLTKNQDNKLIFSRPDGRVIENQPLPSAGSLDNLRALNQKADLVLDGNTLPIPPNDRMDRDLALWHLINFDPEPPVFC